MFLTEFCNLQVVKYNENKYGEQFSLSKLLGCDRKQLRKHDLSNFYHFAHGIWQGIENSLVLQPFGSSAFTDYMWVLDFEIVKAC